jgi:hypothetical protein
MNPKVTLAIGFFFLFILGGSVLSGRFKTKPMDSAEPSFDQPGLYSKLDPLLGFAHDPDYKMTDLSRLKQIGIENPDLKKLDNGFVLMEYLNDQVPLRIAILGACTSDSYLYHGGWPYRLHLLLKEKNISHQIYNGSVSGYNSFQSLAKLIRDVFSLKAIGYVIYVGPNDYSEYLVDRLSSEHQNFSFIKAGLADLGLTRLFPFLQSSYDDVQLGVEETGYVTHSAQDIRYMKAISDINRAKFSFFVDVAPSTEQQIERAPWADEKDEKLEHGIKDFLDQVGDALHDTDYTYFLGQYLPKDQKVFYDGFHLNEAGQTIVARAIAGIVFKERMDSQ